MSKSKPKRFYSDVQIETVDDGTRVCLDGKPIKTPARNTLRLPTPALAEAVAHEWRSQAAYLDIPKMHLTRLCHVALDRTPDTRAELAEEAVRYASTDVCCYRVRDPKALAERQDGCHGPLLSWASDNFDIRMTVCYDVLALAQPKASLDAVRRHANTLDDFALTGLVYGCGLLGSLILPLSLLYNRLSADQAFGASRLEEDWQTENWGEDHEASEVAKLRANEVVALGRYFKSLA